MKRFFGVLATTAVLTLLPSITSASPVVLDQSYLESPGGTGLVNYGYSGLQLGQTFTVGLSGTLSSVDVLLRRIGSPADIDVILAVPDSIYPTGFGAPLATATIHATDVGETGTWTSVDFSAFDVDVSPDMLLSILLAPQETELEGNQYVMFHSWNPQFTPYPGGASFGRVYKFGSWGQWLPETNVDFAFRTYVDQGVVASVPDAGSTLLLFGFSLVGIAAVRHRLQK